MFTVVNKLVRQSQTVALWQIKGYQSQSKRNALQSKINVVKTASTVQKLN